MSAANPWCVPIHNRRRNWTRTRGFRFYLLVATTVWSVWLGLGGHAAVQHLLVDWRIALTMVAGSLVGGGTAGGGGAIAFPVLTKLLHVSAPDARNFALAIQSVGMGAATLSILHLRIPIEKRAICYAGLPGMIGVVAGTLFLAPKVPSALVRVLFTVLVSSMGVALLLLNRDKHRTRNDAIPACGGTEKLILCVAGLFGGIVSALVGSGENTVLFIVLVLLFRISEKVVTPTTVVLMTMVTVPGFVLHWFVVRDVAPVVVGYWLAAVPVAVAMAPIGAVLCSRMTREAVVKVLLLLIGLEVLTTIAFVAFTALIVRVSLGALVFFGVIEVVMWRAHRYLPHSPVAISANLVQTVEPVRNTSVEAVISEISTLRKAERSVRLASL